MYSANLVDWRIAKTVLVPNDNLTWDQSLLKTGYMYAGARAAYCTVLNDNSICTINWGLAAFPEVPRRQYGQLSAFNMQVPPQHNYAGRGNIGVN